mmetsp:Transcript_79997/g.152069  ORF Transcript_79997/g.152069 Transcript_79997/m.152069 type:complete len:245 (+) Transcript_79997:609-1343(+)
MVSSGMVTPVGTPAGGADSGALTNREGQREGSRATDAASSLPVGSVAPPPLPPTSSGDPRWLDRLSMATAAPFSSHSAAPLSAGNEGRAPLVAVPTPLPRAMPRRAAGRLAGDSVPAAVADAAGAAMTPTTGIAAADSPAAAALVLEAAMPVGIMELTRPIMDIAFRASWPASSVDDDEYISGHAGGSTKAVLRSGYNWCNGRCRSHSGRRTRSSLPTGNRPSCNHSRIVHPGIGPYSWPTLSR